MATPTPVTQRFSEQQLAEITQLWGSGKTQAEIAAIFNVPRRTMMKVCSTLGLRRNHKEAQRSRLDPEFAEQVRLLRQAGKSIHAIKKATGRSISAIQRVCTKLGIETTQGPAVDQKAACRDYEAGLSMSRTAAKHGISTWVLGKILRQNGVVVRDPAIAGGGSKPKITTIDLPPFRDCVEWFREAYTKYGMSSIAAFCGKSVGWVGHRLEKYGIETLDIAERQSKLDDVAVTAAYDKLRNMSQVARRFNCTTQSVKNILERNGITPTTTSEMFSGAGNPFFGKQHPEEIRRLCAETGRRHGMLFWVEHPEYIEVVRQKQKELWSDLERRRADSELISKLRAEGKCGPRRGQIESRFGLLAFDAKPEMEFIEHCEADRRIVHLERDFMLIQYDYQGARTYNPDFRVWLDNGDFLVIEVKADWYAKQPKEQAKIKAGFGRLSEKFLVAAKDWAEFDRRIELLSQPVSFDLDELVLCDLEAPEYLPFFYAHHYKKGAERRGFTVGAKLAQQLVAAATFGPVGRAETARRHGLEPKQVAELVRFCIHPDFHKPNLASWLLSRAERQFCRTRPDVRLLVSFAEDEQGHIGTIYKAANWEPDGMTSPSYHYVDKRFNVIHKKTVYERAVAAGMREMEYAITNNLTRVPEKPKYRFLRRIP